MRHVRHSLVIRFFVVALALCIEGNAPRAEFKLCNQSVVLYNVAVGAEIGRRFFTEGWWTLPPNSCVTPIKEDLSARYVYVYATTVTGDRAFAGDWPMCVDTRRFRIEKIQGEAAGDGWDCWVRGYQQAKFREINTGNAKSWTVFLSGATQ